MKNYLLPENGNFYKANMHCHSVLSDGHYTVEQLKEVYKRYGYNIIAFTDHNVLIDHSDLNDDTFMAITGYEADINDLPRLRAWNHTPCVHLNFYAKDAHNTTLPCYNPKYVFPGHDDLAAAQKYSGTNDYPRDYAHVNAMIADTCKEGFLCCINHPTWSEQDLEDVRNIDGAFAMEIYNNSCYVGGYPEFNHTFYDDMLRHGKNVYCIAADDNHDVYPEGSARWDSCGGFIMIKSDKLEYNAVMNALEKGYFYASTGPQIFELYTEGEELHIKTSPAARISVTTYGRRVSCATAEKAGDTITEATLHCLGLYDRYIRVTVDDGKGHFAWTHAYFDACNMENGRYDNQTFRDGKIHVIRK